MRGFGIGTWCQGRVRGGVVHLAAVRRASAYPIRRLLLVKTRRIRDISSLALRWGAASLAPRALLLAIHGSIDRFEDLCWCGGNFLFGREESLKGTETFFSPSEQTNQTSLLALSLSRRVRLLLFLWFSLLLVPHSRGGDLKSFSHSFMRFFL